MGRLSEIIETAIGRNKETWAAQSAYKDAVIQAALLTPEADWTRPVLWKDLPQFLGAHPESHFDYMENTWNYLDSLAKWTKKAREQHAARPWPSNYAGDAARAADTVISERCFRVAARTSSAANGGIQEVPWAYLVAPALDEQNSASLFEVFNFDRERWGVPEKWSDQIVAMNRRRDAYVETTRRSFGMSGDPDEHKMYGTWLDAAVFYGWRKNAYWPYGLSELPKSRVYDIDDAWKLRVKIAQSAGLIMSNGVEIGPLTMDERKDAFFMARIAIEHARDAAYRYSNWEVDRVVEVLTKPVPDRPFVKGYSYVRMLWYAQWLFALSDGAALLRALRKAGKDRGFPAELARMIDYMKIKPVKASDL